MTIALYLLLAVSYVLNVKEPPYRALGNGYTDDRPAIQRAINDAFVTGIGAVYLPSGRYFVSSNGYGGLALRDKTMLYGNGASSIILYTNKGAAIYALARTNVLVRDLAVDEQGLGVRGIEFRGCLHSSVIGCWVLHSRGYSVYFHYLDFAHRCELCTVQECHVIDNNDVGIELRGATGCSVLGNTVSSAGGEGFHVSYIAWDGATDCLIANNISEGVTTNSNFVSYEIDGVEGAGAPWETDRIIISNNVSRGAATAVVCYGEPQVPNRPRNIRFRGNLIANPTVCAFMIANSSNITLSDNTVICAPGVLPLDVRCPPLYPWFGMVTNLTCHGNTVNGIPYQP